MRPIRAVSPAAACSPALSSFLSSSLSPPSLSPSSYLHSYYHFSLPLFLSLFRSITQSSLNHISSSLSLPRARALTLQLFACVFLACYFTINLKISTFVSHRSSRAMFPLSRILSFMLSFSLPLSLAFIPNIRHAHSFFLSSRQPGRISPTLATSFTLSFSLIRARTHPFVPYEKDCKPITHNSLLLFIIIISYS